MMRKDRTFTIAFVMGWLIVAFATTAWGDERLQLILENLRENEALYENIEINWRESYRKVHYHPANRANVPQAHDIEGRSVQQQGMFYLKVEGTKVIAPDAPSDTKQTVKSHHLNKIHDEIGYDGETCRVLERRGDYVGNIRKQPTYDSAMFHPHTVPLRFLQVAVPLWTFMSGRDAILAHPKSAAATKILVDGLDFRATYLGEEEVDGLLCQKVSVEWVRTNKNDHVDNRRIFWLAVDRNYLPVKTVGYNYFYSKKLPITETTLSNLQEIEPGIWFPFSANITVYEGLALLEHNRPVVSWVRDYVVMSASLDPEYDVAFFRDVPFPDGTTVYEFEGGEIAKGYVKGREYGLTSDANAPANGRTVSMLVLANIFVLTIVGVLFIWRRRKARSTALP